MEPTRPAANGDGEQRIAKGSTTAMDRFTVSRETAQFWRTPPIPGKLEPKDKVLFMIGQVVVFPKNHTLRERRFWLSTFLPWQVKHLWASIRMGVIGNADSNAMEMDLNLFLALSGYANHPKRLTWLIGWMINNKLLGAKILDERPPRIVAAVTMLDDIPQHFLAHQESVELIQDGATMVRGQRKGEIGEQFMVGLWTMIAGGRNRPLAPEDWELRKKAIRLNLAQRMQIIVRDTINDVPDDDEGGQDAKVLDLVTV
jgi:hypothetical protein